MQILLVWAQSCIVVCKQPLLPAVAVLATCCCCSQLIQYAGVLARRFFGHSHALMFASSHCYMLLLLWLHAVVVISYYNMQMLNSLHILPLHGGVVVVRTGCTYC